FFPYDDYYELPDLSKSKPALEYPERLKVPGVAGIGRHRNAACWIAFKVRADWEGAQSGQSLNPNVINQLGRLTFPELYQPPYSDVAAEDSWIDNPEYKGGD